MIMPVLQDVEARYGSGTQYWQTKTKYIALICLQLKPFRHIALTNS